MGALRVERRRFTLEVKGGQPADKLDHACEEAARFLVDQWGFTIEEAFVFLSVACDANICQACRPHDFSTIARVAVPKVAATPRPFA